jgi:hypothetical protein
MSRTYRRRGGDTTWKARYERPWWREDYKDRQHFEAVYHSDGYGTMHSTPSAWTNTFMTRPQRAEVRRLTHQVMLLRRQDLDDAPVFPHPKRPHHYYW